MWFLIYFTLVTPPTAAGSFSSASACETARAQLVQQFDNGVNERAVCVEHPAPPAGDSQ